MGFGLTKRQAKDIQVEDYLFIHDVSYHTESQGQRIKTPTGCFEKVTRVEETNNYDTVDIFYYSAECKEGLIITSGSNYLSILSLTN